MYEERERFAARLAILLAAMFTVYSHLTASHAGTFSTTYEGGSETVNGNPGTSPFYPQSNGTYGFEGILGSNFSVSGPITATFTYAPASGKTLDKDPQPTDVVIEESCSASWSSLYGKYLPASGTCDNGLNSGITSSEDDYGGVNEYSVGYRLTKGNSGGATCSPNVSFVGTQGWIVLDYSATVCPVSIALGGTTPDNAGNPAILIGQQCSASVNDLPVPTGWTAAYSWSVTGKTFTTWNPTAAASGPDPTTIPIASTNSTASWYWSDQQYTPETVTCKVTVSPPSGSGASPCSITLTKKVGVYVPQVTATGKGGTISVIVPGAHGYDQMANNQDYWLMAGTGYPNWGMTWHAVAAAPEGASFGPGSLELAQLWTPNYSWTLSDGAPGGYADAQGLDNSFPYGGVSGNPYDCNDNPGIDVSTMTSATLSGTFKDYLMYIPPGAQSICVPVAEFDWSVNDIATELDNNWANWPIVTVSVTPGTRTGFDNSKDDWPVWTQNNSNK
jgi:hypothetical protein